MPTITEDAIWNIAETTRPMAIMERLLLPLIVAIGLLVGFSVGLWAYPDGPAQKIVNLAFMAGSPDVRLLKTGWSTPEPWGTWSIGQRAEIGLPITEPNGDIAITIEASAFLAPPAADSQEVNIEVNGVPIGRMSFSAKNYELTKQFTVPRFVIAQSTTSLVTFIVAHPRSPIDFGLSADNRKLGWGLRKITLLDPISE
jgi:hypothetical protein